MIRKGDRVRTLLGTVHVVLRRDETAPGLVVVAIGANVEPSLRDAELELLCAECNELAVCFRANDQTALCEKHRAGAKYLDVRTKGAVCPCICGEDLAAGKSEGVWTLAEIACEYRTCVHCGSTRAFMPAPVLAGRHIGLYNDPDSSEIYTPKKGKPCEWASLLDALEYPPPSDVAELIRNGVVLARVYVGPGGVRGWKVQEPLPELPVRV